LKSLIEKKYLMIGREVILWAYTLAISLLITIRIAGDKIKDSLIRKWISLYALNEFKQI